MQWWMLDATMNAVIAAVYFAIAFNIGRGVWWSGTLRGNPLALATAGIFFTCAVHHGSHTLHMIGPFFGIEEEQGLAVREAFNHPHISIWDVISAAVGCWYWSLRSRFPALVRGSAVFEDLRERQRQALEIHDNIVQGLATAKLSFEVEEREQAMEHLEKTLQASRKIITDLLGSSELEMPIRPGDLRRDKGAHT